MIINIEILRSLTYEFFIYGYKTRADYHKKLACSYDNEKRRLELNFGEYFMSKKVSLEKKKWITIDGSEIQSNPLFN